MRDPDQAQTADKSHGPQYRVIFPPSPLLIDKRKISSIGWVNKKECMTKVSVKEISRLSSPPPRKPKQHKERDPPPMIGCSSPLEIPSLSRSLLTGIAHLSNGLGINQVSHLVTLLTFCGSQVLPPTSSIYSALPANLSSWPHSQASIISSVLHSPMPRP